MQTLGAEQPFAQVGTQLPFAQTVPPLQTTPAQSGETHAPPEQTPPSHEVLPQLFGQQ